MKKNKRKLEGIGWDFCDDPVIFFGLQLLIEVLISGSDVIFFWIFWIILTGFCVYGFYYADNNWLEN